MHRTNWDDLRFVLSVAEAGSFASAARILGVNHTTVLRRVQAFEAAKGVRIFDRRGAEPVFTPEGEELVAAARKIERVLAGIDRSISGQDQKPEGPLRVTTTDTIFLGLLGRAFADFQLKYPRIQLELAISTGLLNLTRRDADVAIRPSMKPPDMLVGRQIGYLAFAVYASRRSLARVERRDLVASPWIGLGEILANTPVGRWISAHVPDSAIVFRADTFLAVREAAEQGMGLAAMPCFLGDAVPGLERVTGPVPEMDNPLWILTHEDLRRSARVRVFMDAMAEALREQRDRLQGRCAGHGELHDNGPVPGPAPAIRTQSR